MAITNVGDKLESNKAVKMISGRNSYLSMNLDNRKAVPFTYK